MWKGEGCSLATPVCLGDNPRRCGSGRHQHRAYSGDWPWTLGTRADWSGSHLNVHIQNLSFAHTVRRQNGRRARL